MDTTKKALKDRAAADDHYEIRPPVLPAVARQHRLAELDRRILELEHHEAETLEVVAEAGMPIDYRPDMSPAAALGMTE